MNALTSKFRSTLQTLGRLLPAIALVFMLGQGAKAQTSPGENPPPPPSPVDNSTYNPYLDGCCECIKLEIIDVPSVDKAGSSTPRFNFENGQRTIKIKVLRETSASCVLPLTQSITGQVSARSLGSSGRAKSEQTFTIAANAMASQELTFSFDHNDTCSGCGENWEFVLKCNKAECSTEPFLLGSGCSSCDAAGVCPVDVESGCFSASIPTLRSKGGLSSGTLHFFTPDFSFPGRAGLRADMPSSYVVTKDAIGITQIDTGSGLIEVADVAGQQAFTVTHKDAAGAVIRTTVFAMVTEAGVQRLRADSTFDGSTTRQEQTQPTPGTLVLEKGHVESGSFEPLWRETYVKTTVSAGLEKQRRAIEERASASHAWSTTSDIESTYEKQVYDWVKIKEIIDPNGEALTTTWTYYQPGETTGPEASTKGVGRLKRIVRYDGYEALYTYGQYTQSVTTPYANNVAGQVTTTTWDPGSQSETVITTVGGQTLSKTVTAITPTSESKTVYTSAGGTLTTVTTYNPSGQDFGGLPIKVAHPDQTLTIYTYTREAGGGYTTRMDHGAGTGNTVTQGTRTITTKNSRGTVILSKTEAIGHGVDGVLFACTAVTSVDNVGRALTTAHHPTSASASGEQAIASGAAWTTHTQYSCCGVAQETDKYGITTFYAYDSLKRQVKSNRLGVTTETVRNGLTTETHRYAETVTGTLSETLAGNVGTLLSKSVSNLAGTLQESWSPDPTSNIAGALVKSSFITTTYKPAAGLSVRSVTTTPDNFSQTTDSFLDGRTASTHGALSPAMAYSYGVNATGETSSKSYVDGSNLRETTTTQHDWAGRPIRVDYMDGAFATMTYNSLGQLISSTEPRYATGPEGVTTLYAYNAKGEQVLRAIDLPDGPNPPNGTIDYAIDTVTYSETTPVIAHGMAVMRTTSKIWNPADNHAEFVVAYSDRSANGLKSWNIQLPTISEEEPRLNITSTTETILGGSGNWTTTSIAPDGTKQVQTYTAGRATSSVWLATDNSVIQSASYTYDALNRPTATTDSRTGATATAYLSTTADIAVSTTDPGNRTTSFAYDIRGRRVSTTLPDNTVTTSTYTPRGELASQSGSQTYPVSYTYDYAGRQKTLTTSGTQGATTTWHYSTTRGFLTRKAYQDGNGTDYTYTAAGRLASRTWARGVATVYAYDNGGRLVSTTYSGSTPAVAITYDSLGRQLTQSNGLASCTYSYSATTLQLVSETIAYDLDGTPGAEFTRVIDRSHDSIQRTSGFTLGAPASAGPEAQASYTYDPTTGRLASVSNGTDIFNYAYASGSSLLASVTGPAHTVTNTWEATRNALSIKENKAGATVISQYGYTVNSLGQRSNVAQTGTAFVATRNIAWGYDSLGQVVSADSSVDADDRAYEFDAIGNRLKSADSLTLPTSNNYTPNALNQYTAINALNPAYDQDGNMTSGPLSAAPSANSTLAWDGENRLITTTVNGVTTTYQYDSQSRRIAKTSGGTTTIYVYDGWNLIAQYVAGSLTKSYTWGMDLSGSMQGAGGVGGLLAVEVGTGGSPVRYYPTYDGNGNVSEYLDSAGAVAAHYEYDAFGKQTVSVGAQASTFEIRFSTKLLDSETGLYYYGYRYYDANTGRWPSRDPIEERGGLNLYGFVGNNPTYEIDINGLESAICVTDTYDDPRDLSIGGTVVATVQIKGTYQIKIGCDGKVIYVVSPDQTGRRKAGGTIKGGGNIAGLKGDGELKYSAEYKDPEMTSGDAKLISEDALGNREYEVSYVLEAPITYEATKSKGLEITTSFSLFGFSVPDFIGGVNAGYSRTAGDTFKTTIKGTLKNPAKVTCKICCKKEKKEKKDGE